ncbi:MAG: glycerophosphodiester phosphodiesterase [Ruminococcaceae bacterium]|nr:glycerophosphodiester phosphodiesterase [Oscillospiraceae bacterium]
MQVKTKKRLKIVAIVLAAIALVYAVIALWPRPQNFALDENPMMKDGDLPILIAHGGGNREFPDNTLEAFYNAYSVDPRAMMETDVSITADGVVILSHDTTLDRKTNVTGAIADWNYSDLIAQKVDFGYTNPTEDGVLNGERKHFATDDGVEKYPTDVTYPDGITPRDETVFLATTLEELIVAFPENRINVEIKQEGELGKRALTEILRLLTEYDAFDRVVLASFHGEIYDEFRRLQDAGEVPEAFMYSPGTAGATRYFVLQLLNLDVFFGDGMCVFQLPMEQMGFNLATKGLVNNAHRHNLAVHYWTINDVEDMKYLIEIGADGIMTDYPHRLQEVYDAEQ